MQLHESTARKEISRLQLILTEIERQSQGRKAQTAPQIPAQYHGYWCEIEPAQNQSLYKRCREPDSEAAISIRT
jgi:hypothetical protein